MKKTILSLAMALLLCVQATSVSLAHKEDEGTDDKSGGTDGGGTTITVTAADYDITTNSDNTVTFLRADGTPISNATVTVKSGDFTSGQEADIEMEVAMPATGIFDYSPYLDKGVTNLRVTDSDTGATVQYMIDSGEVEVSAGKNKDKSGDGSGGGTSAAQTGSNMMYIGGGIVAVLAAGTGFMMMKTKKKKAAFAAAQAEKKASKNNKAKKAEA